MTLPAHILEAIEKGPQVVTDSLDPYRKRYETTREFALRIAQMTLEWTAREDARTAGKKGDFHHIGDDADYWNGYSAGRRDAEQAILSAHGLSAGEQNNAAGQISPKTQLEGCGAKFPPSAPAAPTPPSQWIPCSDRLPEEYVEVLLYHCIGDSRAGDHAIDVAWYSEKDEWGFPWDRASKNPAPRWAIAWMSLPPAPKQEDKP